MADKNTTHPPRIICILRDTTCPNCEYDQANGDLVNYCNACCPDIPFNVCDLLLPDQAN